MLAEFLRELNEISGASDGKFRAEHYWDGDRFSITIACLVVHVLQWSTKAQDDRRFSRSIARHRWSITLRRSTEFRLHPTMRNES
jgi:hypothetical protein